MVVCTVVHLLQAVAPPFPLDSPSRQGGDMI